MILSKTKLSLYSRLGSRKQREKLGLFIAEGSKCVADTIASFQCEAVIALEGSSFNPDTYCTSPYIVGDAEMRQLSQLQTLPDVIAVYRMPTETELDEKELTSSLTLLLDAVQDPGNLGTILRIASWFGINQVVLGKGCADPFNPKAVQASMGAVGMVRIVEADLPAIIDSHPGIPVCGTLLDGEDIYKATLPLPAMIAMGNEGNGLSEEVRKRVTLPLLIPSFATGLHAESLNVAAATAITISEFRRQEQYSSVWQNHK